MEKGKIFLILTLVFAVLFASCSNEVRPSAQSSEPALASVNLIAQTCDPKALTAVNADAVINAYLYSATSAVPSAKGAVTSFTNYNAPASGENEGKGNIEARFSPGEWTFTVRGVNSSGGVLYEGTKTVYLEPGPNTVTVDISPVISQGNNLSGTLSVDITAPRLQSDNAGIIDMTYTSLTAANASAQSLTVSSKTGYPTATEVSGYVNGASIAPGLYLFTVNYYMNQAAKTAGQAVSTAVLPFRIIENTTTQITGNMEGFLYSSVELSVSKQELSASMAASNGTFTVTAGGSGYESSTLSYRWYINGTAVGTSSSLALSSCVGENKTIDASAGYYCVTCVVMAENSANGSMEAVCCSGHFTVDSTGTVGSAAVD